MDFGKDRADRVRPDEERKDPGMGEERSTIPGRQPELDYFLTDTEKGAAAIAEHLESLEKKLEKVLRAPGPEKDRGDEPVRGASSPMGERVRGISMLLYKNYRKIQDIEARLEV